MQGRESQPSSLHAARALKWRDSLRATQWRTAWLSSQARSLWSSKYGSPWWHRATCFSWVFWGRMFPRTLWYEGSRVQEASVRAHQEKPPKDSGGILQFSLSEAGRVLEHCPSHCGYGSRNVFPDCRDHLTPSFSPLEAFFTHCLSFWQPSGD